jgi:hypothetical protein
MIISELVNTKIGDQIFRNRNRNIHCRNRDETITNLIISKFQPILTEIRHPKILNLIIFVLEKSHKKKPKNIIQYGIKSIDYCYFKQSTLSHILIGKCDAGVRGKDELTTRETMREGLKKCEHKDREKEGH